MRIAQSISATPAPKTMRIIFQICTLKSTEQHLLVCHRSLPGALQAQHQVPPLFLPALPQTPLALPLPLAATGPRPASDTARHQRYWGTEHPLGGLLQGQDHLEEDHPKHPHGQSELALH